jgi:hypothetical protein
MDIHAGRETKRDTFQILESGPAFQALKKWSLRRLSPVVMTPRRRWSMLKQILVLLVAALAFYAVFSLARFCPRRRSLGHSLGERITQQDTVHDLRRSPPEPTLPIQWLVFGARHCAIEHRGMLLSRRKSPESEIRVACAGRTPFLPSHISKAGARRSLFEFPTTCIG